jgi:hypothetical protein
MSVQPLRLDLGTPRGEAARKLAALIAARAETAERVDLVDTHSSITITLDRYGHLLPGNESEAADLLEQWPGLLGVPLGSLPRTRARASSGTHPVDTMIGVRRSRPRGAVSQR